MDWQALFLTAEGRIGRRDFWIGFLIIMGASLVLNIVPILGHIVGLLLLWPQTCIHTKRLHDAGRSGWLLLIPFGATLAAGAVAAMGGGLAILGIASGHYGGAAAAGGMGLMALGAAGLIGIAFLLWVGLSPGQPGPNLYGEEPIPTPI